MKKIYLTLILSTIITTSAFATCPASRPAKWMDDKCYTCENVVKKIKSYKGTKTYTLPAKNPTQKQIKEFQKGIQEVQKLSNTINNIKQICSKPTQK